MRKSYIELIVGFLVAISVLLVLASGYLSYKSISSIVSSIRNETGQNQKLNLIKSIATNLEKGEQSFRVYTYSKDEKDLKPYKDFLENIDNDINALKEAGKDNPKFQQNIDTISDLIEKKIQVWDEILSLYNSKVADQYLDTLSKKLESKVENDSLRKNRSIFKKIFQRKKKVDIDEGEMISGIQQMKSEGQLQSNRIREKEKQLAGTNSQITEQLYNLIKKMEDEESLKLKLKAGEADKLARETYRWIGWIAVSGTISALLVIFVLSRYLRRSRAYQRALVASRQEAENLAKTKERFIANVSHELRTPMSIISGFLDQILKNPLEKNLESTLRIIKSSSDHLVRIIGDILDFSKLQSGKMKLEPIHFRILDVLEEVYLLFTAVANENGNSLTYESDQNLPPVLYGDPLRLKQILINLVGNAIKFTHNGQIRFVVNADKINEDHFNMNILVEDTGIGIDAEHLDVIFQDFTQAEKSTSRMYGGTGLGLSIVKQLIDLQQGTIKVKSEKNKGTSFTCTIPYQTGDESKIDKFKSGQLELPENLKNLKVLCVDDEIYNRKLMISIFEKWNLTCSEAGNGLEALEKIKSNHFDVLFVDVRMPGMDGFEVAKFVRENLGLKMEEVAIILSTAITISKEDQQKYLMQGINGYIPKPFTEEQLLLTLKSVLKPDRAFQKNESSGQIRQETESSNHVDLEELYRFADQDKAFVKEMLEKFIESFEVGYQNLVSAVKNESRKQISDIAHKMVSPCRHIGARALVTGLKKIEKMADENTSFSMIGENLDAIRGEFGEVKQQIESHLANIE